MSVAYGEMNESDDSRFGFRWGNVLVQKLEKRLVGRLVWKVVAVESQRDVLHIYVEEGLGEMRVWLNGKELTQGTP